MHLQAGHRKISKKEKSKFTIWRNAYPQQKDKPSEPDWDIATKYLSEGMPGSAHNKGRTEIQPHVAAEIDADNAEAQELAKRAGVNGVRSSADFMKIAEAAAQEAKKDG